MIAEICFCIKKTNVGSTEGKLERWNRSDSMGAEQYVKVLMDEGAAGLNICLYLSLYMTEELPYLWRRGSLQRRVAAREPLK